MASFVSGPVVVVGTVNLDLSFGIDRLPEPNETLVGATFEELGGGKGANSAAAAAATGTPAFLLAAVGDDRAGVDALAELRGYGVDTSHVVVLDGVPTGRAACITAPDANVIVVAGGANGRLDVAAVRRGLADLGESHGGGACLVNGELPDDLVEAAIGAANAAGMTVLYNASPARPLTNAMAEVHPLLVVNEVEAAQLAGTDDPRSAARQLGELHGAVVVTLGAAGVLGFVDGHMLERPALAVDVVDTVGAGDAFGGTFAGHLASTGDFAGAIDAGIAAGARAVSTRGARTWLTRP